MKSTEKGNFTIFKIININMCKSLKEYSLSHKIMYLIEKGYKLNKTRQVHTMQFFFKSKGVCSNMERSARNI